jgi:hypothetical protein
LLIGGSWFRVQGSRNDLESPEFPETRDTP